MNISFLFFVNAIGFGIGLAMDAFSVSLANGLNEPNMKKKRMCLIAGTFALFQIAMPLIGWSCVHYIASAFQKFQPFIPWIALILLLFIGGKMLIEGIKSIKSEEEPEPAIVGVGALILQGIATSIDALSVGFTIADLNYKEAILEAVIIGIVTFFICIGGLILGKKFGTKLSSKATILGGVILIAIGLEIFITGILG
ncbi:MAG: manganese efflux pump MntP family protein [Lachnospiraceae bacterium]|nr:manganese efflux pump MntP family protein [Lachnospiraceae bacterium]